MAALEITEESYCQECNSNKNLTIDHVIPQKFKGFKGVANQQILCRPCNQAKGSKLQAPWVHVVSISNYFGYIHKRLVLEEVSEEVKVKIRLKLYGFFEKRCSAFLAESPSRHFVIRTDKFFIEKMDLKIRKLGFRLKTLRIEDSGFPVGKVPATSKYLIQ